MKKRRYKATNVKRVDWERVAAQTREQRIIFGIDVAKEEFFAVLMKVDQSVIETIKWMHPQQTRELSEHLLDDLKCTGLEVVLEPSGNG